MLNVMLVTTTESKTSRDKVQLTRELPMLEGWEEFLDLVWSDARILSISRENESTIGVGFETGNEIGVCVMMFPSPIPAQAHYDDLLTRIVRCATQLRQ